MGFKEDLALFADVAPRVALGADWLGAVSDNKAEKLDAAGDYTEAEHEREQAEKVRHRAAEIRGTVRWAKNLQAALPDGAGPESGDPDDDTATAVSGAAAKAHDESEEKASAKAKPGPKPKQGDDG